MKHIVSFSGGKDSTAMLLMMLEKNMQIDEIIFCDTGIEFDEMYAHVDKVKKNIGMDITVLKSEKTFEYYLFEHKKRSEKNKDIGYGFPRMMTNRWCTSRLKTDLIKKHLKQYEDVKMYVGIAYDEPKRLKNEIYPLYEWKITEQQALDYCFDKGYEWNGLYKKFSRVSCWCCPMQGLKELYNLYKYYPEKWKKLKEWEGKTYNNFRCDYTLHKLEMRFKSNMWWENNQQSMFTIPLEKIMEAKL